MEAEAARWVAQPGTSEHQTGLALDIVAAGYQILDEEQEDTAEQKWLMENSWKYGFILRYPSEKSDITGIGYEPWHYRYVGKAAAADIYRTGVCLEEYLSQEGPEAELAPAQTIRPRHPALWRPRRRGRRPSETASTYTAGKPAVYIFPEFLLDK